MADSNGDFATVLGPDARFKGELQFEKGVRLLGMLEGQVTSKGDLLVAEGATLEGEVDAGNVRIDGVVRGNLKASGKIHLSASAKLEGDLHTARLEVADGAVFVGRCVVGSDGNTGGSARPAAAPPAARPTSVEPSKGKDAPQPLPAGKKQA